MTARPPLSPIKVLAFILIPVVSLALLVELSSWLILVVTDAKVHTRYNRVVSGYSVFTTTPNFTFLTNKTDPSQEDVTTDDFGFVHDTPISIEKPANTIRIFLNGGSALFGAGQARVYSPEIEFPSPMYSYPDSIAGKLKAFLREQRPDLHFEVINAAAYTKRMHQSLPDYLSTISRFAPDFMINMDGYNDLNAFVSGTPFSDLADDLQLYIDLEAPPRFPETLNSYQVMKRVIQRIIGDPFQTGLGVQVHSSPIETTVPRSTYIENEPTYIENSKRFLDTLDRYAAVLREDEVEWLFVLQPMVDRGDNKELTDSEAAWQRYVQTFKNDPVQYREILRYFFDEYLSDELKRHVEDAGFSYIDMGKETMALDRDFQLFTDYCHLTVQGNVFVAERMGRFVLDKLESSRFLQAR